jgi:hypothetical protein
MRKQGLGVARMQKPACRLWAPDRLSSLLQYLERLAWEQSAAVNIVPITLSIHLLSITIS